MNPGRPPVPGRKKVKPRLSSELLHILFGAERGGCERLALQLIRHLPQVRHRVLLLGPDGPMGEDFRAAGGNLTVVPKRELSALGELVRSIAWRAANPCPSAVMLWHGLVWLPPILHALRKLDVPVGVHGGNPAHTMPWWVDWKYILLGIRYPVLRPPTYICASQHVADSFECSRYLRRLPRVVVPNGVEVPPVGPICPRPFTPDGTITIGMLARLDEIKDQATLVRAFALFRREFPTAVLELGGTGRREPALRQLVADLGLTESVRFLGQVADVYGVMARWDLFAFATTEREGLGNALIEAMMLGLPCVVTDVGPMREVCREEGTAILVPPGRPEELAEALQTMARDVSLRRELGAKARISALPHFHPHIFAQRYAEILRLEVPHAALSRQSKNH